MNKFKEYLEQQTKNEKLEKSILCSSEINFEKVLKKLKSLNYKDGRPGQIGSTLNPIPLSQYNYELGYRVINLYSNKTIKFALKSNNLSNVIKDIEFLN
jgi:hypothetical protein